MSKTGAFLLAEETLKTIIAVICILFLVGLFIIGYNYLSSSKKTDQAKEVLSRIDYLANSLNEDPLSEEPAIEKQDIPSPEGWHLYSFVEYEKPNSCLNENCLCICDNVLVGGIQAQIKKCDEKGECLIIPTLATSALDLKINGPDNLLFVEIKKQDGQIFVEEKYDL